MTTLIAIVLVLAAIFIIWRMLNVARPTVEPPEEVAVREPVPRRPLNRSGAVAIAEPDDESHTDARAGR
jgi:biopolymer transport protein ExbD